MHFSTARLRAARARADERWPRRRASSGADTGRGHDRRPPASPRTRAAGTTGGGAGEEETACAARRRSTRPSCSAQLRRDAGGPHAEGSDAEGGALAAARGGRSALRPFVSSSAPCSSALDHPPVRRSYPRSSSFFTTSGGAMAAAAVGAARAGGEEGARAGGAGAGERRRREGFPRAAASLDAASPAGARWDRSAQSWSISAASSAIFS
ncbi:hypothetical protein PVAP13_9KG177313 [Panicum virgatum]|uniref:Uncharacterized protein n=1 Tax=Panicum virgatum TaxID=38727 RepID=A0A8T0NIZ3_PANVG|nr:hypothetical protein PVAP13_9KG177313 [Panicum virgatum]